MDIYIHNFRCIDNKKIKLPLSGMVLLDGDNGVGKSTICKAITWCMYGGQGSSIYPNSLDHSTGRTSVSIVLQVGIKVFRAKGPEELTVQVNSSVYHGKGAQEFINNVFGDESIWYSCSYLPQKSSHPLISSTPLSRYKLIYTLTFGSADEQNTPEIYAAKVKTKTKKTCDELIAINAQIDLLRKQASMLTGNTNKKVEKIDEEIKEERDALMCSKKIHEQINIRYTEYQKSNAMLNYLTNKLKDKKEEDARIHSIIEGDETIEELDMMISVAKQIKKEYIQLYDYIGKNSSIPIKYMESVSKHPNAYSILKASNHSPIETAKALMKEFERKERIISIHNDANVRAEKAKKIKEDHVRYNKYVNALKAAEDARPSEGRSEVPNKPQMNKFLCPKCDTLLILNGKKLTTSSDACQENVDVTMERYETILRINKEWDRYNTLKSIADALQQTKPPPIPELDNIIPQIPQLPIFDVGEMKSIAYNGPTFTFNNLCVGEIIDAFKLYCNFDVWSAKNVDVDSLILKKTSIERKKMVANDIAQLKDEIEKLEIHEFDDMEMVESNNRLKSIEDKINVLSEEKRIAMVKKEIGSACCRRNISSDELESLELISKTIDKVSADSMEDVVRSISMRTNEILFKMFDDDIRIKINTTKEVKSTHKTKFLINVILTYRGIEYDNASSLSGGEETMLSLALSLGMSQTLMSGFLILDESFSCLSDSNRIKCFDIIKEYASNRCLINVCHEINKGIFDSVITVQ